MALTALVNWDVATTGSDTNGGGFDSVSGVPGTDYSQQDSPQITYTDLVIGATTTQLTSAGNAFTSAYVGNIINITSGTGFTTGRYQVMSVSGSTATMDRSVGTAASSSGNGKCGGRFATITAANTAATVDGQIIHVKSSATYTHTTETTLANALTFIGYSASHYDNGTAPTITTANNISMFGTRAHNATFINFTVQCTNGTPSGAAFIADSGNSIATLMRVRCTGFKYGIYGDFASVYSVTGNWLNKGNNGCLCIGCRFDNMNYGVNNSGGGIFIDCLFDTCSIAGMSSGTSSFTGYVAIFDGCVFKACSYGAKETVSSISLYWYFRNCTFANSTNDGFLSAFAYNGVSQIGFGNCVFYGNGGKGINVAAGTTPIFWYNNAFGSNTGGNHTNIVTTQGDITLSASAFVSSSDVSPNSTSSGGALLRSTGVSGIFDTTTNTVDVGAVRHADPGATTSQLMISV